MNAAGRGVQLVAFVLIGRFFGTGAETDAIFLYAAPLYVLIAVSAGIGEIVLIPGMRQLSDAEQYRRFRNNVLPVLVGLSVTASLCMFAVLSLVAPPPSGMACLFLLMMAIFGVVAAFYNAALHAREGHFRAILAPFPGGVAALCVLFLATRNINGLAAALLAFEAGRAGYLALATRMYGLAGSQSGTSGRLNLTRLFENGRYQLLASSAIALNPVIDVLFASTLEEGAITALEYASKLWNAVPLVFSGALILLHLQWTDVHLKGGSFTRRVRRIALWMGVGAIPITAVLILLAPWLMGLLYGNGEMAPDDIARVTDCLTGYLPGAVPFVASLVLLRAFSAKGGIRNIAVISLASLPLNAALNALFIGPLGLMGLALATSFVYTCNFAGLWLLLDKD